MGTITRKRIKGKARISRRKRKYFSTRNKNLNKKIGLIQLLWIIKY